MNNKINISVPDQLKNFTRWVCWQYNSGKKIPFNPSTNTPASVTKPSTWVTFEEAIKGIETGKYDGIGFVICKDDPFIGIDIDDAIDTNGNIAKTAKDIITSLDTYTEVSPSGSGFHIIAKVDDKSNFPEGRKVGNLEFYTTKRYLTITGNVFADHYTIENRQHEIETFLEKYIPKNEVISQSDINNVPSMAVAQILMEHADKKVYGIHKLLFGVWSNEQTPDCDRSQLESFLAHKLVESGYNDLQLVSTILYGSAIHRAKCFDRSPESSWREALSCAENALLTTTNNGSNCQTLITVKNTNKSFIERFTPWKDYVKDLPPLQWIWQYNIAKQHLTLLGGDPGAGKSTLVRELLKALFIDKADNFLGYRLYTPKRVAVVTEESAIIWKNTSALKPDEDYPIDFLNSNEIATFDDWISFCTELETNPVYDLVILDSLNALFRGQSINDAQEINNMFTPLLEACRHGNFAVLLLDHNRKDSKDALFGKAIAGSYAKSGNSDFIITLKRAYVGEQYAKSDPNRIFTIEKTRIKVPDELIDGIQIELTENGYTVHGTKRQVKAEQFANDEWNIINKLEQFAKEGDLWVSTKTLKEATGLGNNRKRFIALMKQLTNEGIVVAKGHTKNLEYALSNYVKTNS